MINKVKKQNANFFEDHCKFSMGDNVHTVDGKVSGRIVSRNVCSKSTTYMLQSADKKVKIFNEEQLIKD